LQIYINKQEAEMLLKAIHELQHVVAEMELEEEGSSGYTPTDMVATNTLKLKIKNELRKQKSKEYVFNKIGRPLK
tara:strand:- start:17478 stop:17702 length:225 start_codon:yes stop_codon:yes gene_type:complete